MANSLSHLLICEWIPAVSSCSPDVPQVANRDAVDGFQDLHPRLFKDCKRAFFTNRQWTAIVPSCWDGKPKHSSAKTAHCAQDPQHWLLSHSWILWPSDLEGHWWPAPSPLHPVLAMPATACLTSCPSWKTCSSYFQSVTFSSVNCLGA